MRIGMTGSSGLIGAALGAAARERGDEVVRFIRPTSKLSGKAVIRWDPSTDSVDDADLKKIGGLDAVVHLAGAGIADRRWSDERKKEILESRTRSTRLLASAIAALPGGCPVVASGSAIGYYGSRGEEVLDETSNPGSDFLADVCVQWEQAASEFVGLGAKVAFLRTGIVMSPRGGALKRQLSLFRLGLGGPLSTGRQWLSPISLHDEVRAILWTLDHAIEGPVNLTSPDPITNADFTRILARQLHRPGIARVPAFALKLALGAQLATDAVLASQRVMPSRLLESGFLFDQNDTTSIVQWAIKKVQNA
jgi:hypothetical protein